MVELASGNRQGSGRGAPISPPCSHGALPAGRQAPGVDFHLPRDDFRPRAPDFAQIHRSGYPKASPDNLPGGDRRRRGTGRGGLHRRFGYAHTFVAGETRKTVSVAILDDAHDYDGETLTLTLSNPAPADFVRLGRATATGTIRNPGPTQRAWLARFGRTVAEQIVDAVGASLEAGADATSHLTLAGESIAL